MGQESLGYRHIFGPVPSRRLGFSLGIDVIPVKTCSFDCVYCEVGRTTRKTVERENFFDPLVIVREFERFLDNEGEEFDVVTFSGSGEPTLYLSLGFLAKEVKKRTQKPLAILTNSSLLFRDDVLEDLDVFDIVLPSLDAVDPDLFARINRPHPSITVDLVKEGLFKLRSRFSGLIFLEILFVKGFNDAPSELTALREFVEELSPHKIHINTVFRPAPEPGVLPLDEDELERIRNFFGEKAEICGEFRKKGSYRRVGDTILKALSIRPMTLEDLSKLVGRPSFEISKFLDLFISEGVIVEEVHGGETFFRKKG